MSKYSNFESLTELQSRRDEAKEARKLILEKAKQRYDHEERLKEKARKQGEGTWMLDAVSQRIQKEEKALKKAKKEKKKKKKKEKKKKKAEKNYSSSSASNDSEEEQWVEAKSSEISSSVEDSPIVKGPQLQRESWMEAPLDLIPSISRQDIRDAAQKRKDEAKREAEKKMAPGQHSRELNPYWKDGGTGLPEEKKKSQSSSSLSTSALSGDAGLSWLQKAYRRCKEQAQDEGRSLEEVAAERWGSLKRLRSLIEDAEEKARMAKVGTSKSRSVHDGRFREDRSSQRHHENDSRYRKHYPDSDRDKERNSDSRRDRNYYEEDWQKKRNRDRDERKSPVSSRRSAFRRPGSDDDDDRDDDNTARHSSRKHEKYQNDEKGSKRFLKPKDEYVKADGRGRFKKPGECDDDDAALSSAYSSGRSKSDNRDWESKWRTSRDEAPRWKKAAQSPPRTDARKNKEENRPTDNRRRRLSSSSSSSNSESSSEEDNNEMEIESEGNEDGKNSSESMKILSEEELNGLAAKILRAELMGEETLAAELKEKLENARRMRETSKSGGAGADFAHTRRNAQQSRNGNEGKDEEVDDNVVVLSRTSKSGLVRPVVGAGTSDEWGKSSGRKRKRKSIKTHGELGERKQFFHDDDKFDLKTLVEREKAGTAEDQNSMFARLAGRAGDRDLDVDDMFVSKAAKNQDETHACNRDKMAAIMEHRKVNAALEKCQRCFNKIPKHLIIAIGTKSYLCLPPHRPLTEGHCLIVPMAHVTSATSMDEDVWQEIQLFRKSLVQMFTSQDQDMVVMETVMHLKHFPHTAIECIPLEREVGDLAPIYFKKAIQEEGSEWSDNKKLHDLSKKDIRRVVPKGFPYFSVDFGLQGGYAHVIEDEATFPHYFGREIVGGMLDAEPSLWRKPHKQSFEDQRLKVLQFEKWWSPFDWTRELNKDD